MPTMRLMRADEPLTAYENVALRQMLERLTYGTHDLRLGFALLPQEAQVLYDVLALRSFSSVQLDQIEAAVRGMDPLAPGSRWNDRAFAAFVAAMRLHVDRPEWIDAVVRRLHAAMRVQSSHQRFRLWYCRAALVAFLTIDLLPIQPEELSRLAG